MEKAGAAFTFKSCSRRVLCVMNTLQLLRGLTHSGGLRRPHHIRSGRCGSFAAGCMFLRPGMSLQNDLNQVWVSTPPLVDRLYNTVMTIDPKAACI